MKVTLKQAGSIPVSMWIVMIFTALSCTIQASFFGFNVSGYGWFIPLVVNAIIALHGLKRVRFPLKIWIIWIAVVATYQIFATADNALQRGIILLSPLATGLAVSTFRASETDLEYFYRLCCYMTVFLFLAVLFKTGTLATGVLPFSAGLAPQVMTASILCCIFAARYSYGHIKALSFWAMLAVIPVIAVTRMGMIAVALSLPLTFAPMKIAKRVLFLLLIGIAASSLFFTDRMQKKMFYSGIGEIRDIRWDNPDFATSGRKIFWDLMSRNIRQKPLFGHGVNSSEEMLSAFSKGLTHPHNDWLRLLHDYGLFGTIIFGATILYQTAHLLKTAKGTSDQHRVLFYAGASSFLIFALFMLTDNIILYAAFYGHMHFGLIGLAYSTVPVKPETTSSKSKGLLTIKW